MSFSNFKNNAQPYRNNLNSQHHIIQNNTNFMIERKLVSIHSNDRDYSKYPNSNQFHIKLGSQFDNVQSVRLVDYQFPKKMYVFSDNYCNTKFDIYYEADGKPIIGASSHDFSKEDAKIIKEGLSINLTTVKFKKLTVVIPEGNYTLPQLNAILNNKIPTTILTCDYSDIENKLYFQSADDKKFFFDFKNQPSYDNVNSGVKLTIFNQHINWGAGYHLGFSKNYIFSKISTAVIQYQKDNSVSASEQIAQNKIYIISENPLLIESDPVIYLDIDKLNQMDEIIPYSERTTSRYNDNSSYKNNGAFAKINMSNAAYAYNPSKIKDVFYSDTPIKSLDRLEIKVRHHDGRLVDFRNKEYSMVLEINCLRDKYDNGKRVNVPKFYPL